MLNLSKVNWYEDGLTRNFIQKHRAGLENPESLDVGVLTEAITYCQTYDNPFSEELVRRAGSIQRYRACTDTDKKIQIIKAAGVAFGHILL